MKDSILDSFLNAITQNAYEGSSAWWDNDDLVLEVEMPGYEKGEISIVREDDLLVVEATKEKRNFDFLYEASSYPSKYVRRFFVPKGISQEKTDAEYSDGVLTIKMHQDKDKDKLPKKIKIR